MKIRISTWALLALALMLAGCTGVKSGADLLITYTPELRANAPVPADQAIVLVGIVGNERVNYMQFGQDSWRAINLRIWPQKDYVVAFAVPVGTKNLRLGTFTLEGFNAGYLPNGMSYGYFNTSTDPVSIDRPGIYLLGTLNTRDRRAQSGYVVPEHLQNARERLGKVLEGHEPANFTWP